MKTIIVAACNSEDTYWLTKIPNTFDNGWIKNVDTTYQPHGREAYVYLDYIVGHYNELSPKDEVVFVQGNPFSHDSKFLEHLADPKVRYYGKVTACTPDGLPHADFTPMHAWSKVLNLREQGEYKFVSGAQYRISGAQVKNQPKETYSAMLALTMIEGNHSAYVLERIWPVLWRLIL
jgi:hypothetical protein